MDTYDFIITINDGVPPDDAIVWFQTNNIAVRKIFKNLSNIIIVNMRWADVGNVRSCDYFKDVEVDAANTTQRVVDNPRNWGLDRIDQRSLPLSGKFVSSQSGKDSRVYVLDTGIDCGHPEFDNRAIPLWDYRASVIVGSATTTFNQLYFPYGAELPEIISILNSTVAGVIADSVDNKLRLSLGNRIIINAGDGFPNLLETVFGIPTRSTSTITGTVSNPKISLAVLPQYGNDDNNHGTHVSSIIGGSTYGVAPSANLYSVKCFTASAQALTSIIIEAMDATLSHHNAIGGVSIANMSFGGSKSVAMENCVLAMMQAGILCCIAAGNSAMNAFAFSPAGAGVSSVTIYQRDDVGDLILDQYGNPIVTRTEYSFNANKPLVVGASNMIDQYASFSNYSDENVTLAGSASSNYGSVVDIIAPGVAIMGARRGERVTSYGLTLSGTSQATPHVAGVAALYISNGYNDVITIRDTIIQTASLNQIAFSNGNVAAIDRTPNRLLYSPFTDTAIIWDTHPTPLIEVYEGDPLSVSVSASSYDTNNNRLKVKYNVSPALPLPGSVVSIHDGIVLNCDTGVISGVAPSITADTTIVISIFAIDDRLKVSEQSFSIKLLDKNNPPIWQTPDGELMAANEGDIISVTVEAIDHDGNTITYGLLAGKLPPGLLITPNGEIKGTIAPLSTDTVYSFVIRASDGKAIADRSFSIVVTAENKHPHWTIVNSSTPKIINGAVCYILGKFNVGDLVDIVLHANDDDNDQIIYSMVGNSDFPNYGLPHGLTFDELTGRIKGIISPSATIGDNVFGVGITDKYHQGIDVAYFAITVTDVFVITQTISDIVYDVNVNPRLIASIPGGSRILSIVSTVTSKFYGIDPLMGIGTLDDPYALTPSGVVDLEEEGEYTSYPNIKFNSPAPIDLYLHIADSSRPPQYDVSLSGTSVSKVRIIDPGSGFSIAPSPIINFGGGTGAKGTSTITAISIEIQNAGTGYTVGDVLTVTGGTYMSPLIISVAAVNNQGAIASATIAHSGSYLVAPINPAYADTGNASFVIRYGVDTVTVTDGGIGYLKPPDIVFDGNGVHGGSIDIAITFEKGEVATFFGNILWETPTGDIGTIYETEPSHFNVKARSTGGNVVTYSLSPLSGPLPIGLQLTQDGDIIGIAGFTDISTVYQFTVRASVGASYVDRDFSLLHQVVYQTKPITNVSMIVTGDDRISWTAFTPNIIPHNSVYRPLDPSYGLNSAPTMLVIAGLQDVDADGFWEALTGNPEIPQDYDFHRRMDLCVGGIRSAVARDRAGDVIYEVIYRDVVQPLERTYQRKGSIKEVYPGGFVRGGNARYHVPYPQRASKTNYDSIQYIYPAAISNMRKDLASYDGGVGLVNEVLPLWMRSEQIIGDPNSVLGYVPAIVLGYVKPGLAQDIIQNSKYTDDEIYGSRLIFDRYVLSHFTYDILSFDDNIIIPPSDTYSLIATRDIDGNAAILDVKDLYVFTDNNVDIPATILDMETRAMDHAVQNGRTLPILDQDWQSSDYRPHENPNGDMLTFDDGTTVFDYVVVENKSMFRFPPSEH